MANFILHSDLNCFYASAEINENPSLRGKCVAVCGSTENRHGIVLAKSYEAKAYGVKTGQANWEALKACPQLTIIEPHYEVYMYYSRLVRSIYRRYSNDIEPFGMDENWISLPNLASIDKACNIAQEIRASVRDETGLTVSIGVSFSKIFAKLGSDMKKPDAVTVIDRDNFRERVWPLPATELLYVGPRTGKKLRDIGVYTIGQLAALSEDCVRRKLGKNGVMLRAFARGEDGARVMPQDYEIPIKSVGHGATCIRDIESSAEIWQVIYSLSQDVNRRLRKNGFLARGVSLYIRYSDLSGTGQQMRMTAPTRSALDISLHAYALFFQGHERGRPVRALTVCAINLIPDDSPVQTDMFGDFAGRIRRRALEDAVDDIRSRFGMNSIIAASLMNSALTATDKCETVPMPSIMFGTALK